MRPSRLVAPLALALVALALTACVGGTPAPRPSTSTATPSATPSPDPTDAAGVADLSLSATRLDLLDGKGENAGQVAFVGTTEELTAGVDLIAKALGSDPVRTEHGPGIDQESANTQYAWKGLLVTIDTHASPSAMLVTATAAEVGTVGIDCRGISVGDPESAIDELQPPATGSGGDNPVYTLDASDSTGLGPVDAIAMTESGRVVRVIAGRSAGA